MADEKKTVIIDLKFDVSDFTQSAAKLNKEISDLNKQQTELKKQGQEGSIQYQKNSEALRENRKELAEVNKTISNLTTANKANAGSNEQLKAQLSIMTLEYNKLSKEQRENTARGKELFANINQVTASLKGNEEAIGNNRRSVGDYAKALDGTPFGSFINGIRATGAAFIANPLGLIITAIVAALALLKKAFTSNEEGSNKLAKAMTVISGVFNTFLKVIKPIADFIVNVVIAAFNDLAEKAEFAANIVSAALKKMGFENAAKGINDFVKGIDDTTKAAQKLADAEAKLTVERREQRKIQYQAQLDAEKLRQLRDDESKSIDERIKANEDLGEVLEKQLKREQEIAELALSVAEQNVKINGKTTENLDKLAEAQFNIIDINERIAGQQSEQLANLNSLRRDEAALAKERQSAHQEKLKQIDEERKEQERLFQEVIKREVAAQQQLDEIAIKNIKDKRERELAELDASFEAKQAAIVGDGEKQKELELQLLAEQTKARNELLQQYKNEDDEKKAVERQMELELQEILAENDLASLIELEKAKADAKIAEIQRVAAINESSAIETALAITKVEKESNNNIKAYEKQLTDIKKSENKARLESTLIVLEAVHSLALGSTKAAKGVALAQLAISTGKSIASIVEMSTAAGSAAGTAAGVVTAGIGAAPAFTAMKTLTYLTALGQIMGNFAEAKSIINQGKAAKGGIFGGKSHSEGGTKGYFDDGTQIEVERGELFAVVNKRNTSMLNYLNGLNTFGGNGKSFFERGGISKFADGGIGYANVSKGIEQSQQTMNGIVDIIRNMPNPVVVVQDINNVQSDVQTVEVISQI